MPSPLSLDSPSPSQTFGFLKKSSLYSSSLCCVGWQQWSKALCIQVTNTIKNMVCRFERSFSETPLHMRWMRKAREIWNPKFQIWAWFQLRWVGIHFLPCNIAGVLISAFREPCKNQGRWEIWKQVCNYHTNNDINDNVHCDWLAGPVPGGFLFSLERQEVTEIA
jgi:hypothetical protein